MELGWFIESVRAYFDGGMEAVRAVPGFWLLLFLFAGLVPTTLIMLGIGEEDFHETPLGKWLGVEPDDGWPPPRTQDIDGDGTLDCWRASRCSAASSSRHSGRAKRDPEPRGRR